MSEYIYIHSLPLQKALRYDFADCADRSFVEGWFSYRARKKAIFHALAQQGIPVPLKEPAGVPEGSIPVTDLMKTEQGLWALIKKFEVFGKFYSCYLPDLKRHPDSCPASSEAYISFGQALTERAHNSDCLQYLSTLLKLLDALCSLPEEHIGSSQARRMADLIGEEFSLVHKLEGRIHG